jgi:alkanesulfonate monooxygenase SsuD/methylene tetrahydromethanopterin reductase-like flavin-dependent oxidoreductase (luciferase family)
MLARSGLAIGLFSPNCDGGLAITKVPERWRATWENNLELAAMCDAAGIDFLLPIGRWRGHGGETNFQGSSLETLTWACGLLAQTSRLTVFATVHAPMIHPIVAAKQLVTIDHVSHGRLGLNLVCGWNEGEFQMFGQEQREHDERYAYGQEWLDVVRLLWRSDATSRCPG